MPSLADSLICGERRNVPHKVSNMDMYVQVCGISLAAINICKLVQLL